MAPREVHLKAGRTAFSSTQRAIVRKCQEDLKNRLSKLLVSLTSITEKEARGRLVIDDEVKKKVYRKWEGVEYIRENLRVLREEWDRYKVKEVFPEMEVKDKYTTADEYAKEFMTKWGIDNTYTSNFRPIGDGAVSTVEESEGISEGTSTEGEGGDSEGASTSAKTLLDLQTPKGVTKRQKNRFVVAAEISSDDDNVDTSRVVSFTQDLVSSIPRVRNAMFSRGRSSMSRPLGRVPRPSVSGSILKPEKAPQPSAPSDPGDDGDDGDDDDSGSGGRGGGGGGGRRNGNGDRGNDPHAQARRVMDLTEPPQEPYAFDRKLYWEIPAFTGEHLDFPEFYDMFCLTVHYADLQDQFKLNYLRMKLDERTKRMIRNYRGKDYEKAFQAVIDEYTSLASVVSHVKQRANDLPAIYRRDDLEGLTEVVEQLRSITSLFEHYELTSGLEMEIFRVIVTKLPRVFSERYMRSMGLEAPSLEMYLAYLDENVMTARTMDLWFSRQGGERKGGTRARGTGFKTFGQRGRKVASSRPPYWGRGMVNAVGESAPLRGRGRPQNRGAPPGRGKPTYGFRPSFGSGPPLRTGPSVAEVKASPGARQSNQSGYEKATVKAITTPCQECGNPTHSKLFCKNVTPKVKYFIARDLQLCLVCLKKGHRVSECPAQYRCAKCGGRHNVYLCSSPGQVPPKPPQVANLIDLNDGSEDVAKELAWNPADHNDSLQSMCPLPWDEDDDLAGTVMSVTTTNLTSWIPLKFTVAGRVLVGILDTGATVNLIPAHLAEQLRLDTYPSSRRLTVPGGKLETARAVMLKVVIGQLQHDIEFYLYEGQPLIILGMEVLTKFKLNTGYERKVTQSVLPHEPKELIGPCDGMVMAAFQAGRQPVELVDLIKANRSLFIEYREEIGLIETEKCCIRLTHDLPITLRPYRCTPADQENIDRQVAELLEKGIIRVSTSPYSFPVVLVDKKDDGAKTRLCVNYMKLNDITLTEGFPMPKIDDMQDKFLGAQWFTTIDVASGFYHIEVREEDKAKIAFSTQSGHYEWNRMPFGLKNAPVIFQRAIANLLQKHGLTQFAVNYIDDIIIFSPTYEDHLKHLQQVFDMLREEDIRLKLKKCQFGKMEVIYLGYKIGHNSVQPMRSNTEAIDKVGPPADVKSLRGFLGKVNYYHRFIENRAATLYPLYQLLKKNKKWEWDEECEEAFRRVKTILTTSPVLRIFDPTFSTYLYTDASRKGLGAVLKQSDPKDKNDTQFVVGYFSKSLAPYQVNYSTTELELLAIISAIDYWHYYLVGKHFKVMTDHLPLKAVGRIGKPNTRLFNWAVKLRQYDFTIEYRPGKQNEEADFLSRHPIHQLQEVTDGIVMWVDSARIKRAWEEIDGEEKPFVPKKVHVVQGKGGNSYVYRKGDITKDYLPEALAKEVLVELHNRLGHAGYKTLELHFVAKYYHPRLGPIILSVVRECEVCTRVKVPYQGYGTLGHLGPATGPYEIVHIDTKSGFKGLGSTRDNLHLAIDAFSRFVWGLPSKTKIAVDFINLINKITAVQKPRIIVADNYPAIKSKAFQDFLRHQEICMVFTAPNHPSSNGMVERVNQTIVARLTCKRVERKDIAWTTQVREVIEEYNNSVHSVTKYAPIYLMTGHDPDGLNVGESLEDSRLKALENSNAGHERNAQYFNRNKRDPQIVIGDEVYVGGRHVLNRGNLEPRYEGPYRVLNRIGQTTVELDREGKSTRYHVSQLRFKGMPVLLPRLMPRVLTMLAIMALVCPAVPRELQTADPIVWRKTDHMAVVGYNFTTHAAVMLNPCTVFDRQLNVSETVQFSIDADRETCEEAYERKVLSLLRQECLVTDQISALDYQSRNIKRRNRRFIPLAIGLVGGIVSYSVLGFAHHYTDPAIQSQVTAIDAQLKEQVKQLHQFNDKSVEFQTKLLGELHKQWVLYRKLSADFQASQHEERLIAMVLEAIDMMQLHLGYLLDGFGDGKVTSDYKLLFEESPLLKNSTRLKYWTAHPCEFVKDSVLNMKFEIPILYPGIKVLEAEPFLVYVEDEFEGQCLKSFQGSRFILLNVVDNCTRDLLVEPVRDRDLILVYDAAHLCVDHSNRTVQWKTVKCDRRLSKREYVQIKQDTSFYYVYCYKHELKVEGYDTIVCENVVYRFSRLLSFSIDDLSWKVYESVRRSTHDLPAGISRLINQRTFYAGVGDEPLYSDLARIIKEEQETNKLLYWKTVVKRPQVYGSIIGVVIFLVVAVVGTWCCKTARRMHGRAALASRADELFFLKRFRRANEGTGTAV